MARDKEVLQNIQKIVEGAFMLSVIGNGVDSKSNCDCRTKSHNCGCHCDHGQDMDIRIMDDYSRFYDDFYDDYDDDFYEDDYNYDDDFYEDDYDDYDPEEALLDYLEG